jgi:zinc protease
MIDLRKSLAGKAASVRPFIDDLTEGVAGGGSPKDLETLFQLIYMTFTAPRKDTQLFGVMTSQLKSILANQQADPEFAFTETLETTLAQNHPRAQPITAATIDKMNLDKSFDFYKDRFSDASDFTFVFVGSFDLPTIKPLVEKYLASLPATHRKESWRDVGIETPPNVVEKRVEKGLEPKSQTAIVFSGPFQYQQMARIQIRAMAQILEDRLREILREDLGGTYSVSVSPNYVKQPKEQYQLSIEFGSAPDRTEALIKAIFKEIDAFKANGPTDKQLTDEKEGLIREYETNIKQNGYLLSQLAVRYQYGEDVTSLFSLPDYYKQIDAAMIRDAARKYLDTSRYVQVSLFPAKKTATSSATTSGDATTSRREAPSRPIGALPRGRSQWPVFGW